MKLKNFWKNKEKDINLYTDSMNMPLPDKIIFYFAIVLILLAFMIHPIRVNGDSMKPTLQDGEYIFENVFTYMLFKPERGDIIGFTYDNERLVKRVIGIPGDKIKIKDGVVYVNSKKQDQRYTLNNKTDGEVDLTVKNNEVFVMGDNRLDSYDSRDFGAIKQDTISGKMWKPGADY